MKGLICIIQALYFLYDVVLYFEPEPEPEDVM